MVAINPGTPALRPGYLVDFTTGRLTVKPENDFKTTCRARVIFRKTKMSRLYCKCDQLFLTNGICKLVGLFSSLSKPRPSTFLAPQNIISLRTNIKSYSLKICPSASPNGGNAFLKILCGSPTFHSSNP